MRIVTYAAVDWLHMSRDVHQIMAEYWTTIDTLVWGRKTWDFAASHGGMAGSTAMQHYVFSRTLHTAPFRSDDPRQLSVS